MEKKSLLTPLELKVMNVLWRLRKAFVKEMIEAWPDQDAPKYNTVSTIVRILQEKGFVDHKAFGRSHQYFPAISKAQYQKRHLRSVVSDVFSGSMSGLVSALLDDEKISKKELSDLKKLIEESEVE
jgi:BlaI family penicillinase repressor